MVALVGAVLVPGRASAQPAATPVGMQVNADAQQLFFDGQTATKQKQWDRARTFFQGAWRIQQHWKIAVSLGRAELRVGRMRDAAEHLTFFLREVPAGALTPADREQVNEMLEQARATVGALKVTGAPEGAEVALDGVVVGKAPLEGELFVEPGPHRVEARRSGYVDGAGAVAAVAGREAGVDLRMVKVPVTKPLPGVGPAAGGAVAVPSALGPNKGVVIAGAALTAVGLGMGIGFNVMSLAKEGERDRLIASDPKRAECVPGSRVCLDAAHTADVAKATLGRAALASYIAAGIFGAGTLTYALFPRSSRRETQVKTTIVAGPGIAAVTLSGSW